jgi:DNA-binding CsgD family transcriptional regulator
LRPLIVATGARVAAAACSEAARQGYSIERGWLLPGSPWDLSVKRLVCSGRISSAHEASAALMAAARGAGIVAEVAGGELARFDGFVHDLRRLGEVEIRAEVDPIHALSVDERRLLDLLAEGETITRAARRLAMSKRTAERRLAHAREMLHVPTTAEAVVLARSGFRRARA